MISDGTTVVRTSLGGWLFTWPAGTAPYQIWLDGFLVAAVDEPTWTSTLPGYESLPPEIEILNANDPVENEEWPPYVLLQWRGNQSAAGYVVQQATGISATPWKTVGNIRENGRGYYQWVSPPVPDNQTVQYQVLASDILGNLGTPMPFNMTMVCNPKGPAVAITITAPHTITVSAA